MPSADARGLKRVIAASFIGTTIEWYDFFPSGTAAALVFNKILSLFPPISSPCSRWSTAASMRATT